MKKALTFLVMLILISTSLVSCDILTDDKDAVILDVAVSLNDRAGNYTMNMTYHLVNIVAGEENNYTIDATAKFEKINSDKPTMSVTVNSSGVMYIDGKAADIDLNDSIVYRDGYYYMQQPKIKEAISAEATKERLKGLMNLNGYLSSGYFKDIKAVKNSDDGYTVTCGGMSDEYIYKISKGFEGGKDLDINKNKIKVENFVQTIKINTAGYVVSVDSKYQINFVYEGNADSYDMDMVITYSDFDATTVTLPEDLDEYSDASALFDLENI